MSQESISVEILGKNYQIKCPENMAGSLQNAAKCLDEKMRTIREASSLLSLDRVAVMAALNLAHELLTLEYQTAHHAQIVEQRLRELQNKMEDVLFASEYNGVPAE